MNPYKLSADYERLYSLILGGMEIVCFVDYRWTGGSCRDIARARKYERIDIGVRGCGYWLFSRKDGLPELIAACKDLRLEYIDPESEK